MKTSRCALEGIRIFTPEVHADARGHFLEAYHQTRYQAAGVEADFVQDSYSSSRRGVLRGLHFTRHRPQAQLLTVMRGHIFDVVVDLRRGSPTFGQWHGEELRDDRVRQIYMPHGFAHGFCVLSESADLHYKASALYTPDDNFGLRWDDPQVGIRWPLAAPLVSERDRQFPLLEALDALD